MEKDKSLHLKTEPSLISFSKKKNLKYTHTIELDLCIGIDFFKGSRILCVKYHAVYIK
jgi:hypothetical protein